MFPDELSIFPLDREMKLAIDLAPEKKPVTKALHKMVPIKMRKLAKQMQGMLEEEAIRPGVFHTVHQYYLLYIVGDYVSTSESSTSLLSRASICYLELMICLIRWKKQSIF